MRLLVNEHMEPKLSNYGLYLSSFWQMMNGVEVDETDLENAMEHDERNRLIGLAIMALASDDTKETRRLRTKEEFEAALQVHLQRTQ